MPSMLMFGHEADSFDLMDELVPMRLDLTWVSDGELVG